MEFLTKFHYFSRKTHFIKCCQIWCKKRIKWSEFLTTFFSTFYCENLGFGGKCNKRHSSTSMFPSTVGQNWLKDEMTEKFQKKRKQPRYSKYKFRQKLVFSKLISTCPEELRLRAKKFLTGWQKCISRVQKKNILGAKTFIKLNFYATSVRNLAEKFSAAFLKLHSKCSEDHFGE